MLGTMRIRNEQMRTFEGDAARRFEDEMVAHSRAFTPRLCEVLGEEQLRVALRAAIEKAGTYGFTNRGPIRLYIELMFLCGSAFDTDPQYPGLGKVLRATGDQMERAEEIHQGSLDYLDKVSGPRAVNLHKALKDVLGFVRVPLEFPDGFVAGMLREMERIYPQKAAYIGEPAMSAIVEEGLAAARKHGFDQERQQTLLVVLMYSFGHGCTNDPLYPWIARTLNDEKIVDPAARAARLEKKAVTWLEHVVARNEELART